MVRVGFIGCGFIARYHALQLALCRGDRAVTACFDQDHDRARRFAGELADQFEDLGRPRVCGDLDEVLRAVDAVFVCTWTAAHLEVVRRVASAGLPVFCEKPLGVDLDDAIEVAASMRRCPVQMVGLVLRSSPAMLAVRELIRDDSAGRIMNVVFRDDQYLPVGGLYESDWRADPGRAGSGALLEHSIHDVDLLEWFGEPVESVSLQRGSFHGVDGIEDSVTAAGRFVGGGSFALASVWHDILTRPSLRRIEVFCERRLVTLEGDVFGPVSMESDAGSLNLEGDELASWLSGRGIALESAEQLFLDATSDRLQGRSPPQLHPNADDALRAHEVVDAMYVSGARGGAAVPVEVG